MRVHDMGVDPYSLVDPAALPHPAQRSPPSPSHDNLAWGGVHSPEMCLSWQAVLWNSWTLPHRPVPPRRPCSLPHSPKM